MSQRQNGNSANADDSSFDELKRLLTEGVSFDQPAVSPVSPGSKKTDDEDKEVHHGGDTQGAIGLYAEAAQDMATAGLELSLGRHFACVDYCNQVAEKAAQAVSLLRVGRRSMYDHDLRALGAAVVRRKRYKMRWRGYRHFTPKPSTSIHHQKKLMGLSARFRPKVM